MGHFWVFVLERTAVKNYTANSSRGSVSAFECYLWNVGCSWMSHWRSFYDSLSNHTDVGLTVNCFPVWVLNRHFAKGTWEILMFEVFMTYRKIPKISPRAFIFQRSILRGLFLEGLIYGGKFVLENRLGLYSEGNLPLKIDWASL